MSRPRKKDAVTYYLPIRMRKQLAALATQLNTSSNEIVERLIRERLEVAELWPPPYDDSHLYIPRRVLAPHPKSAYTREQQGFDPVITDPEQLKFLEETRKLITPSPEENNVQS